MKLTLRVDSLSIVQWWVDMSYLTHFDCRGDTGAMISLDRGTVLSFLCKQKLNVRSSTKGGVVRPDDALGILLWCKYFIKAHRYTV